MNFLPDELTKQLLKRLVAVEKALRSRRKQELASITEAFEDPQLLAQVYIQPQCQHHNPTDYDEDEDSIPFVKEGIFTYLGKFLRGGDVLKAGRSQLFVLSDAGMGKTSLLIMIKLHHLLSFWPKAYKCVLLKLGEKTLEQVAAVVDKPKTILLLDGLDEDPLAYQRTKERLLELLSATKAFRRVITTCRTQFFPDWTQDTYGNPGKIEIGGYICPTIYLSLFDEKQVDEYLRKRFSKQWGRQYQAFVVKAKRILSNMHSLKFRPLLLAHVEDLMGSTTVQWTEYAVYKALVDAWLLREERKLHQRSAICRPSKDQLLNSCLRVAVEMQKQDDRAISLNALMALAEQNCEDPYVTFFDLKGRSLLNRRSDGTFRFSHYSIQEFLIAKGVIEGNIARCEPPLRCTDLIFRFVTQNRTSTTTFGVLDLRGQDLNNQKLAGANFKAAVMKGAKLVEADLQGANLASADLTDADASLSNLSGANLSGSVFTRAVLSGACLRGSNAESATFFEAKCNPADFSNVRLIRADFRNTDLAESQFCGANLTAARFNSASLKSCDFSNATLTGTDFSGAVLDGCMFHGTTIDSPHFKDASFKGTKLGRATIKWSDWSGFDLSEVDLADADLSGRKLAKANLSKANLKCGQLQNAKLKEANLERAALDGANLRGAQFTGCNIAKATLRKVSGAGGDFSTAHAIECDFSDACLVGARFNGANLKFAKLTNADLSDADLTDAILTGVALHGARLTSGSLIDGKHRLIWELVSGLCKQNDLTGADFTDANLFGLILCRTKLVRACLQKAVLESAKIEHCDLSEANLAGANLRGASLFGTLLDGADLSGADLTGADFESTRLNQVNLTRTSLNDSTKISSKWRTVHALVNGMSKNTEFPGVDLADAFLKGANFANFHLKESRFQRAQLSRAFFTKADLTKADLSGADLSEAKLNGANLSGANLEGANLKGATLAGALNLPPDQITLATVDAGTILP